MHAAVTFSNFSQICLFRYWQYTAREGGCYSNVVRLENINDLTVSWVGCTLLIETAFCYLPVIYATSIVRNAGSQIALYLFETYVLCINVIFASTRVRMISEQYIYLLVHKTLADKYVWFCNSATLNSNPVSPVSVETVLTSRCWHRNNRLTDRLHSIRDNV